MIIDRGQLAAALPRYELIGQLGAGAFGLVLAGRHRQLERDDAIKVLSVADEAAHSRFLTEAKLLAHMNHRHIVRVYDYLEHEGLCLIIMELLAGGSLTQRPAGIPAKQACAVGVAVAEALSYAHSQGVLHRDIKPDNVLFDADGLVKVTDFGIAKIFDGSRASASAITGTPAYMAPEQISGGQLGPGTDIYALGVMLYEMLAGTPPFDPALPLVMRHQQQLTTMPPRPGGVPPAVADVIMHALARDMQERPRSAWDFARDLAAAADHGYGPHHPDQPPADLKDQPIEPDPPIEPDSGKRRTRWAWVTVAAAVVAAAAVLAIRLLPGIAGHSGQPGQASPTVHPGGSSPVTPGVGSASTVPAITKVAISGASGDYTVTITGAGFGPPAASLPMTGDLPNFRIADSAQVGFGEWGYDGDAHSLDYQAWTNSRIVVSGLGASPGDALVMALWNRDSGHGVTWGGDVPPAKTPGPAISSVQFTGPPSDPQIIIRGSGFGTAPATMPYTGSIQSFAIGDWRTYHSGNGPASTWTGGVTENFLSWSPTMITLGGFSGTFGQSPNILEPGDPLSIQVWSPASGYDAGPQTAWGGRMPATLVSASSASGTPTPHPTSGTPTPQHTSTTQSPSHAAGGVASPLVIRQNTQLNADIFCSNLTIEPGVTLTTNGYNIYCSGTVDNEGTIVTGPSAAQNFPLSYGGSGGGSTDLGGPAAAGFSTRSAGGEPCSASGCTAGNGSSPALPSLSLSVIRAWYQAGMNRYLAGAGGGSSPVVRGGSGANGLFIEASSIIAGTIDCAGGAGQNEPAQSSAGGGGGGVVILAYLSRLTPGNYAVDGGYTTTADGTHHEFGGNGAVVVYRIPNLPISIR